MRDAIKTTIKHPLLGVGPSMFMQYRFDNMPRENGMHKPYMPTHNTYLEIASECGIPGLLSYLFFLWAIFAQTRAARKLTLGRTSEQADQVRAITMCVEAALVYFAVCAAFMTCDKHPHQFVLAGLAIALQKMTRTWLGEETPLSSPPMGSPSMIQVPIVKKRSFPVGVR